MPPPGTQAPPTFSGRRCRCRCCHPWCPPRPASQSRPAAPRLGARHKPFDASARWSKLQRSIAAAAMVQVSAAAARCHCRNVLAAKLPMLLNPLFILPHSLLATVPGERAGLSQGPQAVHRHRAARRPARRLPVLAPRSGGAHWALQPGWVEREDKRTQADDRCCPECVVTGLLLMFPSPLPQ